MLLRSIIDWKKGIDSREPVARFLKSYSVFVNDHTGKEDKFFDQVENKGSLSDEEHTALIDFYEICRNNVGGRVRMDQMIKMIMFLEDREWMS